MKTRIISGAVALLLFVGVILLQGVFPYAFAIMFSLLSAVGGYEVLYKTGIIKNKLIAAWGVAYCFITPAIGVYFSEYSAIISLIYVFGIILFTLKYHKTSDISTIASAIALPIILGFAFTSALLLSAKSNVGLFYFYLCLIFAWGSDTFAYFAGSFLGKHKLCPEISPKKTVEGAVGGIAGSMLLSYVLFLVYEGPLGYKGINLLHILICAALLAVVGMIGDLFASQLKRKCGIKDYGNLMPGHGGVLDRFDSVLLIAPCFYTYLSFFGII